MKLITKIVGACLGLALIGSVGIVALNNSVKLTHASAHNITLNIDNSPDLSNGEGTQDINGVEWEYYNASENETGHVTIGHQGYAGVASTTDWGYTGVDSITANFTANDNELWLLTSYDGIEWNEEQTLVSGQEVTNVKNWRYLRFYNWSDENNLNRNIDITSINIGYECSGNTATEDIDNAREVINKSDNLTWTTTTGREHTALEFTKSGKSSSWAIIGLKQVYYLKDIRYKTVEFDYYKPDFDPEKPVYPSIQLYKNETTTLGSSQDYSSAKSHYKVTELPNGWHHIQVPISALAPTISGYKTSVKWEDTAVQLEDNKHNPTTVSAVKLTVGTCIIDNLRFGSNMETLGMFNNGFSFNMNDEKPYWFKVAWAGEFHSCTMTFEPAIAEQVAWDNTICKSPFYIRGLQTGSVEVTATIVCGYNRQTKTIKKTITIN